MDGLGRTFFTRGFHKAFPSCYGNHAAIEACIQIARENTIQQGDVSAVAVEVWLSKRDTFLNQHFRIGDSAEKALFNLPYSVANALVRGGALPEQL